MRLAGSNQTDSKSFGPILSGKRLALEGTGTQFIVKRNELDELGIGIFACSSILLVYLFIHQSILFIFTKDQKLMAHGNAEVPSIAPVQARIKAVTAYQFAKKTSERCRKNSH